MAKAPWELDWSAEEAVTTPQEQNNVAPWEENYDQTTLAPWEENYDQTTFSSTPPVPPTPEVDDRGFFPNIARGAGSAINQLATLPDTLDVQFDSFTVTQKQKILDAYQAIDEGADPKQVFRDANKDELTFSRMDLGRFLDYGKANRLERLEMRGTEEGALTEAREDVLQTLPDLQQRQQAAAEKYAPRVEGVTDIRSVGDFRDWLGFNIASGAVQLAPIVASAAVAGPAGALGAGTALAGSETVTNRLGYIRDITANLPPEEQAQAIIEYLDATKDVSTMTALVSGTLDLAGPVGGVLKRQLAKEAGKEITEGSLRRIAKESAEEAATGGAQEATQITGERVLGEQEGDALSIENLTRVVDAAAAEAAGSLGVSTGVVGVETAGRKFKSKKLENMSTAAGRAREQKELSAAISARATELSDADPDLTLEDAARQATEEITVGELFDDTEGDTTEFTLTADQSTDITEIAQNVLDNNFDPSTVADYSSYVSSPESGLGGEQGATFFASEIDRLKALQPDVVEDTSAIPTTSTTPPTIESQVADYVAQNKTATVSEIQNEFKIGFNAAVQALNKIPNIQQDPNTMAYAVGVAEGDTNVPTINELKISGELNTNPDTGLAPKNKKVKRPEFVGPPVNKKVEFVGPPVKKGRPVTEKTDEQNAALVEQRKESKRRGAQATRSVNKAKELYSTTPNQLLEKAAKRVDKQMTLAKYDKLLTEVTDLRELQRAGVLTDANLKKFNDGVQKLTKIEDTLKIEQANLQNNRIDALSKTYDVVMNARYQTNQTAINRAKELLAREDISDVDKKAARQRRTRNAVEQKATTNVKQSFNDTTNSEINPVLEDQEVTTDSALESIIKNGTRFERLLARRLRPFLRNTRLSIVQDLTAIDTATASEFLTGANGIYEYTTDTITLLAGDGTSNTTFLHEAIHAATLDILVRSINNPDSVSPRVNELREELIEQMYEAELKYTIDKENGKTNPELDLIVERGDIFGDVTEFIAYGITQPEMQEFLLTVPTTITRADAVAVTGLSKFINIIRQLFSMGENTDNGFVSLLDLTDQLVGINEAAADVPQNIVKQSRSKAKKITAAAEKLQRSKTASAIADNMAKAVLEARDENTGSDLVYALRRTATSKTLRQLVKTFTTTGLTRKLVNDFEVNSVKEVNSTVDAITMERARRIKQLANDIPEWEKFNSTYIEGGSILADVMHMATLSNFDPAKHKDLQAALRNDAKLIELRRAFAATRQDPNASRPVINAAKGAITRREGVIREVYEGTAGEGGVVVGGWNRLQQDENGGQRGVDIYKRARDAYQRTFDEHQQLLIDKINKAKPADGKTFTQEELDNKKKLLAYIVENYQRANEMEVYFPLMRYGDFYLKVGSGRGRSREYYMFESEVARDVFARKRARQVNPLLSLEQQIADGSMSIGSKAEAVMSTEIRNTSQLLKDVFDLLENNTMADKESIKDSVYQMYLMTLPEADIRKRFTKRKGTTGFSSDALRNFVTHQNTSANQLTRLKYSDRLAQDIDAMDASITGRPDANIVKMYTDEVAARAQQESTPDRNYGILDKLAASGNSVVFYWMLSAPKSALIQFTQLPIVGYPVLSAAFGGAATTKVMAKYIAKITTMQGFGSREQISTDAEGNPVYQYKEPSLSRGNYIQENADPEMRAALQEAFEYATDRDIFMSTYASEMTSRTRTPSAKRNNALSKAAKFGADFMSGGFHHAERMNREIMFFSSFELAYADAKKRGLSTTEAQQEAQERAIELTYEGLFNYTNYNKPSLMKANPLTRLGTQFMTFPLQMTSMLTRNFFRGILGLKTMGMSKTDRLEAAGIFTGVLGMTWLFAGAVGLPLFSAMGSIIDEAKELYKGLFDDEDELDTDLMSFGNLPFDVWFRAVFIPRYFGVNSDIAQVLDLTEENAQLLGRVIEAGPLSALTGMNIGASTSLDGMWFRNDSPQAGYEQQVKDFMYDTSLGPFGSLVGNIGRGVEDLERGNYLRAMENFLPAMFRNFVKAERLKQEGLLTRSGAEIKPAEYYTALKLFAQRIGFADTETASDQQLGYMVKQMIAEQAEAKANVLRGLDAVVVKFERDPTSKNYERIDDFMTKELDKYNVKYFYDIIDEDTIKSSLDGRAERRGGAVKGVYVNKRLQGLVFPLLEPKQQ